MFYETQEAIKKFIEKKFCLELQKANLPSLTYIDDFIDFDKYIKNAQLFYDFNEYNFEKLTIGARQEEIHLDITITLKGKAPSELRKTLMKIAALFYKCFEQDWRGNFEGIVDIGRIVSMNIYQAVSGVKDTKVITLSMFLISERG